MSKATRKVTASIPASVPALAAAIAAAPAATKAPKAPQRWDANLSEADKRLASAAMSAVLAVDAAEGGAAKAFGACYSANLHGKSGFSDFAKWAMAAGEAAGLPEKSRASVYRLVNAGVAISLGAEAGQDLSDIPTPTLAAILGHARKASAKPEGVAPLVRVKAAEFRKARAEGTPAKAAEARILGKSDGSKPASKADRAKRLVSLAYGWSDASFAETISLLEAAMQEAKRQQTAALAAARG
jgi:hypothetical protein